MALYIVGTPIGNLGDITKRAEAILSSVDLIACEDTRRTAILLNALHIKKPLLSYYKQKEREGAEKITELLLEGKNVALVSDAGMPVISDPGAVLVKKARECGIKIETVPGPTAVTTAAALAGIEGGFVFIGFLPENNADKKKQIQSFKDSPLPLVFYAGPHDVNKLLAFLSKELGARKAYLAKELTKLHENLIEVSLGDTLEEEPRGEYVVLIEGKSQTEAPECALSPEDHLAKVLAEGIDKKTAIKRVAAERGVPKDEIYKLTLK